MAVRFDGRHEARWQTAQARLAGSGYVNVSPYPFGAVTRTLITSNLWDCTVGGVRSPDRATRTTVASAGRMHPPANARGA